MTKPTIFEKIIAGDIPSTKIYEDDTFFAFFDIHPVAKGHTLLVTREPYRWLVDVPTDIAHQTIEKIQWLSTHMKSALGCDYVQVNIMGEEVPHFHVHLIPRYYEDGVSGWKQTVQYDSDTERDQIAEKVRQALG